MPGGITGTVFKKKSNGGLNTVLGGTVFEKYF
jgi:hypothetical protein